MIDQAHATSDREDSLAAAHAPSLSHLVSVEPDLYASRVIHASSCNILVAYLILAIASMKLATIILHELAHTRTHLRLRARY